MGICNIHPEDRFGRLVVKSRNYEFNNTNGDIYWNCECDCGGTRVTTSRSLNSGLCQSCGCLQKDAVKDYQTQKRMQQDWLKFPRVPIIFPPEVEEWKDIEGYEGLYQISNMGNVYSHRTNKLMMIQWDNTHRPSVSLVDSKGSRCTAYIHRLVAIAFVPNPNGFNTVNHKNENIENNWSTNLEWETVEYNNNFGSRNSRMAQSMKTSKKAIEQRKILKKIDKTPKAVYQYNLEDGIFIKSYTSVGSVKKDSGLDALNPDQVRKCCMGTRSDYLGFLWSYIRKENFYD